MSAAEIYELQYTAISFMDSNFQFWLSATFAVIVAFHFAGDRNSGGIYGLVSSLYVVTTVLFVIRLLHTMYQFSHYDELLISNGQPPFPMHPAGEVIIPIVTLLIMLLGTAGALYFIRGRYLQSKAHGT